MTPSSLRFRGLRTVTFQVPDLSRAREWYAGILGVTPYFDEPFYVGFDIGGFELGLVPNADLSTGAGLRDAGGVTAYWGVDDVEAELARLVERGASPHEEPTDVGGGIRVAAVRDPFGNVLGIIENPGFRGIDPAMPAEVDRYFAQRFGPREVSREVGWEACRAVAPEDGTEEGHRAGAESGSGTVEVVSAGTDEAVAAAEEAIRAAGMPEISISATEGHFLHLLARLVGARRILEIGTLGGVAALWMARALPPAPEGQMVSLEVDPEHAAVARRNLARGGVGDRVEVRVGPALDLLPGVAEEVRQGERLPFDMVFIDADKEPYAEYLDLAIQVTRAGGLIVADNVVQGGRILDEGTTDASVLGIRRFNEALARDPRVVNAAIQTVGARGHDGMALALVLPREAG